MFGTQSGYGVPVPMCGSHEWAIVNLPMLFQRRYTGIIVTSPGSIIVASRIPNSRLRIGKRKYANANATKALESVTRAAPRKLIQTLFQSQCPTGATLNRYWVCGCGRFGPV